MGASGKKRLDYGLREGSRKQWLRQQIECYKSDGKCSEHMHQCPYDSTLKAQGSQTHGAKKVQDDWEYYDGRMLMMMQVQEGAIVEVV